MARRRNKNNVSDFEFRDGFALVESEVIDAIIKGYRDGYIRKNELRVFAARYEKDRLPSNSKVDLYRIVNHRTGTKGIKRLSHKEIDAAAVVVDNTIARVGSGKKKAVARRFLRYIARGSSSNAESLFLLYYCQRRIKQTRLLICLNPKERYARFTYRELAQSSGVRRATLCDAKVRLVNRGLLITVAVSKQNENAYGMLYIDGMHVTLTRRQEDFDINKTVTAPEEKRNTSREETGTLINGNHKTVSVTSSDRKKQIRKMRELANGSDSSISGAATRWLIRNELTVMQAA